MKKQSLKSKTNEVTIDASFKRAFEAIRANQVAAVKALKKKLQGTINCVIPKSISEQHHDAQLTLLHYAICTKNISPEIITALLESGANINQRTEGKNTPLMVAISVGADIEIIKLLLRHHANIISDDGLCALSTAASTDNIEIFNLLIAELKKQNIDIAKAFFAKQGQGDSVFSIMLKRKKFTEAMRVLQDILATHNDNKQLLQAIIASDPDVLGLAIINKQYELVKALISAGADVNAKIMDAYPLDIAADQHDLEMVKIILQTNAKAPHTIALNCAVTCHNIEMAKMLVTAGGDVNNKNNKETLSPFCAACFHGDVAIFNEFLPYADPADFDYCCYIASQNGHAEILATLIERGGNIKTLHHGNNCLHVAIDKNKIEVIKVLLKHDCGLQADPMPLFLAAAKTDPTILNLLLEHGAAPNLVNAEGGMAIENACVAGQLANVEALIKHGAAITPDACFLAAAYGHNHILELFVKHNADINLPSLTRGESPIHTAVRNGHSSTVKLLLNNGADIDEISPSGITALNIAALSTDLTMFRYLVAQGADVNACDEQCITPIFLAVEQNNIELLTFLLSQPKIDLYPYAEWIVSPLAMAAKHGFSQCADILIKKMHEQNEPVHPDIWLDFFTALIPSSQQEATTKLPILIKALNTLKNEDIRALFSIESHGPLSNLLSCDESEKPMAQKYLRLIINTCKSREIILSSSLKQTVENVAEHLGVNPKDCGKLFEAEPNHAASAACDNNNDKSKAPTVTERSPTHLLGLFNKGQTEGIVRVRKGEKEEKKNEDKPTAAPAVNIIPDWTWGTGIISLKRDGGEPTSAVKEVDYGQNQFFYCPETMAKTLKENKVFAVFEASLIYPKIARQINQAGIKPITLSHPPIEINIIDPVTNNLTRCKGIINFEVKTKHAQYKTHRILCVSISADDAQKGSLIVPVIYMPNGLHDNDDQKVLAEKLKHIKAIDIVAPITSVTNRPSMSS